MRKFIPISQPSITSLEIEYVTDAIKSGWVSSMGEYINRFEQEFASYCGTKYALTTSTGTAALHLALLSLGIGVGDEVIIPDLTFISTANAVTYAGAKVILVDIEKDTLCIDPIKIEQAITKNTKAIIPVHLYGHPANMIDINKLAEKYNLVVIEDAAEAHGAEVKGQKTGALGDCGIFSFYGNKVLTCGQGGMITTNDAELYERAKYLRNYAVHPNKKYWHDEVGYNYRITNLQAALGLAQLQRIESTINRKKEIFLRYEKCLSNVPRIQLNYTAPWAVNIYWLICLQIEDFCEEDRNNLINTLGIQGIETRPYFYPVSRMPMYQNYAQSNSNAISYQVSVQGINLPSYFDLSNKEIDHICEVVSDGIWKGDIKY